MMVLWPECVGQAKKNPTGMGGTKRGVNSWPSCHELELGKVAIESLHPKHRLGQSQLLTWVLGLPQGTVLGTSTGLNTAGGEDFWWWNFSQGAEMGLLL